MGYEEDVHTFTSHSFTQMKAKFVLWILALSWVLRYP